MDRETANKVRGLNLRGTISNIRDDGETMRCDITTADGVVRRDCELLMPYGFSSHVDEDGAIGLATAVGGDEGDVIVQPMGNPSRRMGGLKAGEVGLYNGNGDTFVMRPGGVTDWNVGGTLNLTVPEVNMTADVNIDGSLKVTGDIKADGEVEDHTGTMQTMRDQYNAHGHPDAAPPPGPAMD